MRYRLTVFGIFLAALGVTAPAQAAAQGGSYLTLGYASVQVHQRTSDTDFSDDNPTLDLRLNYRPDAFVFGEYRKGDSGYTNPNYGFQAAATQPISVEYKLGLSQRVVGFGQRWSLGGDSETFAKLGYVRSEYSVGGNYFDYNGSTVAANGSLCDPAVATGSGGTILPAGFCATGKSSGLMLGLGFRYRVASWLALSAEYDRYGGDTYDKLAKYGFKVDDSVIRAGFDFPLGDSTSLGFSYTDQGALTETAVLLRMGF